MSVALKLTAGASLCPSMPEEIDVLFLPEIRETEILDDIIPETLDHPQTTDLPLPASPPATVSLEEVTLETGAGADASSESGAPDARVRSSTRGGRQSESPSQASVDEEVVPMTDIYFVSPAFVL